LYAQVPATAYAAVTERQRSAGVLTKAGTNFTLNATDPDLGDSATFYATGGSGYRRFLVDATTGVVRVNSSAP
jgi:hypothetical protein